MQIQTVLSDIGLRGNKQEVYLAALGLGSGSVAHIALKAGLPRTTVHEIIQHLVRLGVVSFVRKGRGRIYTAEPPEALRNILHDKERNLAAILPELTSLYASGDRRPRVRFYEGIEGVKRVFEDTLTTSDKLLRGILSMADLYVLPGKRFMNEYVGRRIAAGIHLHVVRSQGKDVEETWPSSKKELRQLRYAPPGFVFPMTMYMYDKKVVLIGTTKESFGMIIESEDFYTSQKNLFDIMWQISRVMKSMDR